MSRRLAVVRSLSADFLQNVPIQRQIGHQALQPGVLVPQLPQFASLEQPEVAVALLPDVVSRLADPHLPKHVRDWLTGIPLFQSKQDLILGELGPLQCFLSMPCRDSGSTSL